MKNSASVHRVRCATRLMSAKVVAESALHLLPRLRDFGVRKRAKFREKTRECVANFVRFRRTAGLKTRQACTACVAQHARRQHSLRLSQRCIGHRDCAASAFGSAQNFARKRANVWEIFGLPPMKTSAGVHRMRCATRLMSAKVVAESALHLLPRLRDFGVRKRAKFREKTRERVANFV